MKQLWNKKGKRRRKHKKKKAQRDEELRCGPESYQLWGGAVAARLASLWASWDFLTAWVSLKIPCFSFLSWTCESCSLRLLSKSTSALCKVARAESYFACWRANPFLYLSSFPRAFSSVFSAFAWAYVIFFWMLALHLPWRPPCWLLTFKAFFSALISLSEALVAFLRFLASLFSSLANDFSFLHTFIKQQQYSIRHDFI